MISAKGGNGLNGNYSGGGGVVILDSVDVPPQNIQAYGGIAYN
jgi:hypothetical protein